MDLYYKDECAVPISEYPPINIERRPPCNDDLNLFTKTNF